MATVSKGVDEKFCSECAAVIKAKAVVCPNCGCPQATITPDGSGSTSQKKSRSTAGVLALLLGGIGTHKFYLDQPKEGVLYLLFFWTMIPALLGLRDAITLFGMSGSEFDRLYNANA